MLRRGLILGLLTFWLTGCMVNQKSKTMSWLDRFRNNAGPVGPDVVQMDVAVIERPAGDPYLNRDLWLTADEQIVALERQAVLEDNGFRVGQIGGITPAGLHALLTSERSCANPRRLQLHAGKPTTVALGPALPTCRFQVVQDGRQEPVELAEAQCTLEVEPILTPDGRTRLRFTPQVLHGAKALLPRPAPDRSGWMLQEQQPTERYPEIGWEVDLPPNDYVVIGGRLDRPDGLGCACFVRGDESAPVQRLLVIRTRRAQPGAAEEEKPERRSAPSNSARGSSR